jgi:single-strand DNA-binding protein
MHNIVYLIGRLAHDIKGNTLTLAVQRSYKNEKGIYETDFIECEIFGKLAEHTIEYCHKGDLVGIKGQLRTGGIVIIDKISFLATKRK